MVQAFAPDLKKKGEEVKKNRTHHLHWCFVHFSQLQSPAIRRLIMANNYTQRDAITFTVHPTRGVGRFQMGSFMPFTVALQHLWLDWEARRIATFNLGDYLGDPELYALNVPCNPLRKMAVINRNTHAQGVVGCQA